ncbi:hypothetical protein EPA93_47715 [Ktedonosporobacter rubrisoli]|uniref:O-antigen ligase-related domain-containing protein n=1 Tax=Ktedonosporobacter rubrisoli TaxID=2509675 RepID=A0A4P6K4J9_KTERU|nr:O-antigen ligase family protein [Ktedonosporobacter rubrisoli]QBD83248.1 hypothetical protein EPA93_47715 [Ktedonosporobacter rubrisoli]
MHRPPLLTSSATSVTDLLTGQKKKDWLTFLTILSAAFCLITILIIAGTKLSFGLVLSGFVLLLLALAIMRWPGIGFFIALLCTVLVEESPLKIHIFTDELNVFYWPPDLAGQVERPFGYLILFTLFILICHNLLKRRKPLEGGQFLLPLLCFLICVLIGVVHGLSSGGNFKIITLEIRPFWYLLLVYLLTYNLIKQRGHIYLFFWIVILGAGIKALQGTYIYLVVLHGSVAGVRDIMAHEESFFFVALLLMALLFWLQHCYRPQFFLALLATPFILIALIANQRRTDYLALLAGIGVACVLVFCVKPQIRKALAIGMLISAIVITGYVALFSNSSGGLAEPARAIVSIFRPDPRDVDSNQYRVAENYDLKFTVKQNPLIGFGFGKPFLQPQPLADLSTGDPAFGGNPFRYVPHNTIYWVWMRTGNIGFFALLYLFGAIIIRGCLIARSLQDRYLQLVAIYAVAVILIEVFVAYSDYQLFTYRNIIYLGMLMGILLKLPVIDRDKTNHVPKVGSGVHYAHR